MIGRNTGIMINSSAFRTITIENGGTASLKDGLLVIENENGVFEYAVSQLSSVIIATPNLAITSALLGMLQKNSVSVIVCNEKRLPVGAMQPLGANFNSAGRIIEQSRWTAQQKDIVWAVIVRQKIINSARLLQKLGKDKIATVILYYAKCVKSGDITNREAITARTYFRALFGKNFTRQIDCSVNRALNYGYSILASKISRYLTGGGYTTALGLHHCSKNNIWNLTCDLIEPFRVFVDRFVYEHKHCDFDRDYRRGLIEIGETPVRYLGKKYALSDAIELYCHDVLSAVTGGDIFYDKIGDIEWV